MRNRDFQRDLSVRNLFRYVELVISLLTADLQFAAEKRDIVKCNEIARLLSVFEQNVQKERDNFLASRAAENVVGLLPSRLLFLLTND